MIVNYISYKGIYAQKFQIKLLYACLKQVFYIKKFIKNYSNVYWQCQFDMCKHKAHIFKFIQFMKRDLPENGQNRISFI